MSLFKRAKAEAKKKSTRLESTLEKWAVKEALKYGIWLKKEGENGLPDRIGFICHNKHGWIEFKQDENSPLQPAQEIVIPMLIANGEDVTICWAREQVQVVLQRWIVIKKALEDVYGPTTDWQAR